MRSSTLYPLAAYALGIRPATAAAVLGAQAIIPHAAAAVDEAALAPAAAAAAAFVPKAKTVIDLGVATDTFLNRDSCGSVRMGGRTLWTCRDTQFNRPNGLPELRIISSTASWSDDGDLVDGAADPGSCAELLASGDVAGAAEIRNKLLLSSGRLRMYGKQSGSAFFPLLDGQCSSNQAGLCPDGSRYTIWPDSPPMAVGSAAYTWIRKFRVNGALQPFVVDPGTALYKVEHKEDGGADAEALPSASVVKGDFWADHEISYGAYGNVVHGGYAYLFAQLSPSGGAGAVALARVKADDGPAAVEDRSRYEYFVAGSWTGNMPRQADAALVAVPNASAGGQGTYYYSEAWGRFVWIGQAGLRVTAEFFVTTSPAPEGPWEQPVPFYTGAGGNYSLSAYSLQAHPALVPRGCDGQAMVISWTINNLIGRDNVYTTPLALVVWDK
ncbi:hypothetical protein RB601_000553 [Gaeumannomyces tritici]